MGTEHTESINGKVLIAYFSWGGNTAGIAEEIQVQTDADLFEITLVNPYSTDYNTVLDEAQRDQNEQVRLEPATHVENMDEQDNILPGSTNWWVSIPMPTASFLEEYDFSGKTVVPFVVHGTGGISGSVRDMKECLPKDCTVLDPIGVYRPNIPSCHLQIEAWLTELGF